MLSWYCTLHLYTLVFTTYHRLQLRFSGTLRTYIYVHVCTYSTHQIQGIRQTRSSSRVNVFVSLYKHVFASVYKCVFVQTHVILHESYTLQLMCTVLCHNIISIYVYSRAINSQPLQRVLQNSTSSMPISRYCLKLFKFLYTYMYMYVRTYTYVPTQRE